MSPPPPVMLVTNCRQSSRCSDSTLKRRSHIRGARFMTHVTCRPAPTPAGALGGLALLYRKTVPPGARCRLFAYSPADVNAIPSSLASFKSTLMFTTCTAATFDSTAGTDLQADQSSRSHQCCGLESNGSRRVYDSRYLQASPGARGAYPLQKNWPPLEQGTDCLRVVQLMPLHPKTSSSLASFKSRLVFTFPLPAYPGCREKEVVKWVK